MPIIPNEAKYFDCGSNCVIVPPNHPPPKKNTTFVNLADGKLPADKILDGESFLDALKGKRQDSRKPKFWFFPGYLDKFYPGGRDKAFRTRPVTAMRKDDWKILLYHEEWALDGGRDKIATNNAIELYNLKDDISEKHNLANENPAKRDELLNELLKWQQDIGAKVPTMPNPKYVP